MMGYSEAKEKVRGALESLDHILLSGVRYIILALLAFGVAVAVITPFYSGAPLPGLLLTPLGSAAISTVFIIALLMIWRELRDVRIWLSGISEGHSKTTYARFRKHVAGKK